jgi:phosphoribosylformylglycinamidine synthase PurS subunit
VPEFRVRVDVSHRPGILDPAGAAVERALPALGWSNVRDVTIGKSIHLVVDAADLAGAREQVDKMCHEVLVNPVIEDFEVEIVADGA